MLEGKQDEGWHVVDAKFQHESAAIGFDTFWRNMTLCGDHTVGVAFYNKLHDLAFAPTQTVKGTFGEALATRLILGWFYNAITEIYLPSHDGTKRTNDTGTGRFFEDIRFGSRPHRPKDMLIGVMHREYDDSYRG